MAAHARLKNEFAEDEMYHNLMKWLNYPLSSNTHQICFYEAIELPHHKTNKMICVPSEDSDQPGHPPSLIRVFAVLSLGSYPSFLHADSKDSDQTGQMPRLI